MLNSALPTFTSTLRFARSSGCLCILIVGNAVLGCSPSSNTEPLLVVADTDRGSVIGTTAHGVNTYLGIPYAAPPVGALRWKSPTDVNWTEPRSVQDFGPRCFGVSLLDPSALRSGASEDCLSLNIWAPVGAVARPVLFWIHGGGFIDGTGSDYPGDVLATVGDVVVVTINYRLGALGTLAIPSADGGGNLALLDQQFALQWVHRNIAHFGGDSERVTIAGESAGAVSACLHAAMPSSQPLLSAVLMESGACDNAQTFVQATSAATAMATQWGCATSGGTTDEDCLRALPAETIVRGNLLAQVAPIIDGTLVPTSPRAALAAGTFAQVPILAGFNANEGLFFTDGLFGAVNLSDPTNYPTTLDLAFGPLGAALLAQYPLSDYGDDPRAALAALFRDSFFECSTRHLLSSSRAPVFVYEFGYAPSLASPKALLAMHTIELPYVWGVPLPWKWWDQPNAGVPSTPREVELAAQIRSYWTAFVGTHAPGHGEANAPQWPAWSISSQSTMMFSNSTSVAALATNARCAFWDQLYGGS